MNSNDFLISRASEIVNLHQDLKISYFYDDLGDMHIIFIEKSTFPKLKNIKSKLLFEFLDVFPFETLSFDMDEVEEKFLRKVHISQGSKYSDKFDWSDFQHNTKAVLKSDSNGCIVEVVPGTECERQIKYVIAA